ncbi:PIN domain-containing protein [Cellulosimicrobium funkei]|uniref:PIN domain-containing protein n=1 Tax=Cellulosimicrobium funkei TaxID=264251 RepID=UPI003428DF07
MITRVLPDANVLSSKTLRDWLFLIRDTAGEMYTVFTTEDVLAEVVYTYRRRRPDADGGKVSRLVEHMRKHVDDILVEYWVDADYAGVDPDDKHVHAAACSAEIDILITDDDGLLQLEDDRYEVSSSDAFFCLADDSHPSATRTVALRQMEYHRGLSLSEQLVAAGCPDFAARVDQRLAEVLRVPVGERHHLLV